MSNRHKYSKHGYMRAADGHSWRPLAKGPYAAREKPGHEPVHVGIKPECAGCQIPSHGFQRHFSDGECLKTLQGGRKKNHAMGDANTGTAGKSSESF